MSVLSTLAPSLFTLSHLAAFFKIYVLIGDHDNQYIVRAMQAGFSLFDFIFLPNDLIQKASLNVQSLQPKKTSELFTKSGYPIKQSLYVQLIKLIQIVIIGATLLSISGLFFMLA